MKKILFLVLALFMGGCVTDVFSPPSSSPEYSTDEFDNSKTLLSSHATIYQPDGDMLRKSFDVNSAEWSSNNKNRILINIAIPGWRKVNKLQFNMDGKIYNLKKLYSTPKFITDFEGTSLEKKITLMTFVMPLVVFRKLYDAQEIKVRAITLHGRQFIGDFLRKGFSFDGYVDAYTVFQKFLAKLDEINPK